MAPVGVCAELRLFACRLRMRFFYLSHSKFVHSELLPDHCFLLFLFNSIFTYGILLRKNQKGLLKFLSLILHPQTRHTYTQEPVGAAIVFIAGDAAELKPVGAHGEARPLRVAVA